MSNQLGKRLLGRIGAVASLTAIAMCIGSAAWADDPIAQAPRVVGNSSSYNSSSRTVTVGGSSSSSGSAQPKTSKAANAAPTVSCLTSPILCSRPTKRSGPTIAQIGQQAAASITLPVNSPVFGPSPSQNQWNIIPIGYPVWLWTSDTQTTLSQTVANQGLVVSVSATRVSITFNMGDGQQITCTSFTPRPLHNDPFQQSPTCGHTYLTPGQYTITATTTWAITWAVSGQSGSFTVTDTATAPAPLPVGELHAVIVPNPPG